MNITKLTLFITTSLAILLQSNTVMAEKLPNSLLCPEKIDCSRDKSISSCNAIGANIEYWGKAYADATVKKGTYNLSGVRAGYQSPSNYQDTGCSYSNPDYAITLHLSTPSDFPFWEADLNESNKWITQGYYSYCSNNGWPIKPELCSFRQIPLIKIDTSAYSGVFSLSVYANGILIDQNTSIYPGNALMINIYKAWDACSDSGRCIINLMANNSLIDVGSIIVDMDNNMQIVQVNSDPTTGFKISHNQKENSIEIKADYQS